MGTRSMNRSGALCGAAGLMLAAGLALACSDGQGPIVQPPPPLPPTPFVVSNPVTVAVTASLASARTGSVGLEVTYVSLPPGTLPDGRTTTIRNLRTDDSLIVSMVDGGFDPIALAAEAGDTIETSIASVHGGPPTRFEYLVPASSRPRVVRTAPPPHKRDVALNATIVVVFSEPIDSATLTRVTVQLRRGSTLLSGQLEFVDSAHTAAELIPASPLDEATGYELDITQGIHDLDGDELAAPVTVPFTTLTPGVPLPIGPFLISRPIRYMSNDWTFVSAPTGSLPTDTWVAIIDESSGGSVSASAHPGGFDPVALTAAAGDTIVITITPFGGGAPQSYGAVVPASSVPHLVRSDPSPHSLGVWLNSHVTVVFSEPIDPVLGFDGSPTAAHLQLGSTVVEGGWWGTAQAGFDGFEVAFVPTAPLSPGADYELVLPAAITGAEGGEPLAAPILIPFATEAPPAGPTDALLTVEAFSVIAFQYPSIPGQYYYAPQLQLAETGGSSGASVVEMLFTVPGLEGSSSSVCSQGTPVSAGASVAMIGVWYGEYELEYYSPGVRATSAEATAAIIFRDDAGRTDTISAKGPITPGGPPTVYYDNVHYYEGGSPHCPPIFSAGGGPVPSSPSAPHYLKRRREAVQAGRVSWEPK